jgi:mannitol/fructose-specific phosphotransferase system IIA component (Ntr-type)
MKLVDILSELVVTVELSAITREGAVKELVCLLADAGSIDPERVQVLTEAVLHRERLGSTAIGKGVAIPHSKVRLRSSCVAAFGRSSCGIEWHALDAKPVHLVLLMASSMETPHAHLRMLAHASRTLTQAEVQSGLLAAADANEIINVLAGLETETVASTPSMR